MSALQCRADNISMQLLHSMAVNIPVIYFQTGLPVPTLVLLSLKGEVYWFILYFQIRPWIWKNTLGRSKCSRRLLSDGTSCPLHCHTEPKAKYIDLSFIFKFIHEFEKTRLVAVNAPVAYFQTGLPVPYIVIPSQRRSIYNSNVL